jgi:hypothetical protein
LVSTIRPFEDCGPGRRGKMFSIIIIMIEKNTLSIWDIWGSNLTDHSILEGSFVAFDEFKGNLGKCCQFRELIEVHSSTQQHEMIQIFFRLILMIQNWPKWSTISLTSFDERQSLAFLPWQ